MEKQGIKPSYCFIDKTDRILHKIMPSHWKTVINQPFPRVPYQTEVFECKMYKKSKHHTKIAQKSAITRVHA
jgi:hypothetical protein